jgi:large subunit ribosomal protein L10
MAKLKVQKEKDLEELTKKLKEAKAAVFADYRGTTVKSMDKFRKALRKENIFSKVYKITLVKKALEAVGIKAEGLDYKAPIILSISQDDETAPARNVKKMAKELLTFKILEGVVEGKLVSKQTVEALADMPSKDQLRAQVVGTIKAPITGFVNVLAGNLRGLINVLGAMAKK